MLASKEKSEIATLGTDSAGDAFAVGSKFKLRRNVLIGAGLFAAYFIFRFASNPQPWPTASVFGLSIWPAMAGVFLLLLCSMTALYSVKLASLGPSHRARKWLSITLISGIVFVGLQVVQVTSILRNGIYPGILNYSAVYDRATLNWLSHLNQSVNSQIRILDRNPSNKKTRDQLKQLLLFRSGLLDWTESKVGKSGSQQQQRLTLDLLAFQVYPNGFATDDVATIREYANDEHSAVNQQYAQSNEALEIANRKLRAIRNKISDSRTGKVDSETLHTKAEISKSVKQANETMSTITELTGKVGILRNRMEAIQHFGLKTPRQRQRLNGIRDQFAIKLPIVVPNGNNWVWCFLILTAVHGFCVVTTSFSSIALPAKPAESMTAKMVENVAVRWHFVVIAWIILFPLLYLF